MVKSELANKLNKQFPELKDSDIEQALDCILGQMTDTLANGGRVEIRGFGSFSGRHRPPRIARKPKTGATVKLPVKVATHFKPWTNSIT
jgi:integration host factor subunit beta